MEDLSAVFQPAISNCKSSLYLLCDDGVTLTSLSGKKHPPKTIGKMLHNSKYEYGEAERCFNRGIRWEQTLLVTGDLPRTILATTHPDERVDPYLLKLGELRIRVKTENIEEYLDHADEIKTYFRPSSTEWYIRFDAVPDVIFHLEVTLTGVDGITGTFEIISSKTFPPVQITVQFGGFQVGERTYQASYFKENSGVVPSSAVFLQNFVPNESPALFMLSSVDQPAWESIDHAQQIDEHILLGYCWNSDVNMPDTSADGDKANLSFFAESAALVAFTAMHSRSVTGPNLAAIPRNINEMLLSVREKKQRLDNLLNSCHCSTPSSVLDAGFRHAVLNHDYIHVGRAWYEGVHWWNCYWTNNYQISAAISLGQYDKAKDALLFFGSIPGGYSTTNAAGHLAWKENYPEIDHDILGYDGVPYYIYQLWEYTEATGDLSVAQEVFNHLLEMVSDMMLVRDPENNDLLGWHMGCNSFLYQADHLGMPGDGASPSLIMAGMFRRLSDLAGKLHRSKDQQRFLIKSEHMQQLLIERLWDNDHGYFKNHVDFQGISHAAHFYTDLVFPVLYTSLQDKYSIQSLLHLKDSLMFDSKETDYLLMRAGELKPDIFGNNNAMPVQMAETARAFCKSGDNETAFKLMESTAFGSVLYTEAPGSFPERFNNEGKGEFNYLFGSPCASYLYTYINGIFGITLRDGGKQLSFSPSFPDDWSSASISLPYVSVSFLKSKGERHYQIILPTGSTVKTINFFADCPPLKSGNLMVDGQPFYCNLLPILNGTRMECTIPVSNPERTVTLNCSYARHPDFPEIHILKGNSLHLDLPEDCHILDSQTLLNGTASCGKHTLIVEDKNCNAFFDMPVIVHPRAVFRSASVYSFSSTQIVIDLAGEAYALCNGTVELTLKLFLSAVAVTNVSGFFTVNNNGIFQARFTCPLDTTSLPRTFLVQGKMTMPEYSVQKLFDMTTERKPSHPQPIQHISFDDLLVYNKMYVLSAWRNGADYKIKFNALDDQGKLETTAGIFQLKTQPDDSKSVKIALAGVARSDNDTRKLIHLDYPSTIKIPINSRAYSLSILYATEIESRLTGDDVGNITLHYNNGEERVIPLEVGKQISTLFGNFADEVEHIGIDDFYKTDAANILSIGLDPQRLLEFFTVTISTADVQFALMAVNLETVQVHETISK